MYRKLLEINQRPKPFEFYTAEELWADEYTSEQMLKFHLNSEVDLSSRNKDFIVKSVNWIIEHFEIYEDTKIADFGCGPGFYSNLLAIGGAQVTGIDFSQRSIEYARQQAENNKLKVKYIHKNYLEFDLDEKFDLIIMIMCDFCALSSAQRATLLGNFKKLLNPDGKVLLDVYSFSAFDKREEQKSYERNQLGQFWSPDDYFGFLNSFKYADEKVMLDKYTIIEAEKTKVIYNWLQYFSEESLREEFSANGFKIDEILGDVAGSKYKADLDEFAVVASLA